LNNTAEWFGLDKQNKQSKLMGLIKFYFLYIVIVSFHTVLVVRQTIRRIKAGLSPRTPLVLFPKVVRRDADKDLPHFFMYLANYVFYKFGLEVYS
jgi:piezo-type mechanosensitive ion channel component 1/2